MGAYIGSGGRPRPPQKNGAREISRRLDLDDFSKERLWTLTFLSTSIFKGGMCCCDCDRDRHRERHRVQAGDARRDCSTRPRSTAARLLDVAARGRKLFEVLRHRRNGCCATKQTSGAFRAHCLGKGKRARSVCSHHAEQARHRSVKIGDALQILPVSPSDATRHPLLNFLGSKIN